MREVAENTCITRAAQRGDVLPMAAFSNEMTWSIVELRPQLYAMVTAMVGDGADTEDIIQETYARLRRLPPASFFGLLSPRSHVMTIARLAALDHLRKKRAPMEQGAMRLTTEDGSLANISDGVLNSQEELVPFVRAAERLPPRTREILVLHRIYGYDFDEIARRYTLARRTVECLLRRGLERMTGELARNESADATPEPARQLYEVAQQIAIPSSKIIVDVVPKIVVASAALAERLKREPQSLYDLAPRQFELLIAELLEDLGYRVEVTRASRDGGYDLLAYLETELGILLCLVQVKRYRRDRKVGVELVRALHGTLDDARANHAILITTSSFTKDAQEFQRRHQYQLALKDYADIERWIQQYKNRQN